uniref:Uncharacterized protein n=1 Tax=Castor canadensis TaxID=51338 RepID=A0A8C0X522_CASCN
NGSLETGGGAEGGTEAEDFHCGVVLHSLWLPQEPKYQWEQLKGGAGCPRTGGAEQRLHGSFQDGPPFPGEQDWGKVFSLQLPALLPLGSSGRRGQSSLVGWEHRASVTVGTHCRGSFSFPLGGLWFCVFLLLEEMGWEENNY